MSLPKQIARQRDFTGGQVDEHLRRRDDAPIVRAAAVQMTNKRILASGLAQRPGRRILYNRGFRNEEVQMEVGSLFKLCFGDRNLSVFDSNNNQVFFTNDVPWTEENVNRIVWARRDRQIIITFIFNTRPRVLTWREDGTWSMDNWSAQIDENHRKRVPFQRFSPRGITLSVAAFKGIDVDISFSDDVLTEEFIGTRMRFVGRQFTVTDVIDARNGKATINEQIFSAQRLVPVGDDFIDFLNVGDVLEGSVSGARGIVFAVGADHVDVQLIEAPSFFFADGSGETVSAPAGSFDLDSAVETLDAPGPTSFWDEEIMNSLRGWPQSVSSGQGRIIFTGFSSARDGMAFSAIGTIDDFYVDDVGPDDGMFELAPARVQHTIASDDVFVFTDIGVYYIPVSPQNPLVPGSVQFRLLTSEPASIFQPVQTVDGIAFIAGGRKRVIGIRATGQQSAPYFARCLTDYHSNLIRSAVCITASVGNALMPEAYLYVLNDDGTLVLGRFDAGHDWFGWVPWTGEGEIKWVASALGINGPITTTRYPQHVGTRHMVERIDPAVWLDAQILVNNPPAALASPGGVNPDGPLWFVTNQTVTVMDGRYLFGERQVDANGYLVPIEGEDLSSPTLVAGFSWTETLEPVIPHANEGTSAKQTMRRRRIARTAITAEHGTGYVCGSQRIPPYILGDDQTAEPVIRKETRLFRSLGRSIDPSVQIVKDVPGPLLITEVGFDVTV